ncbi:carboxymuconolactone decarboxylase family protein [Caldimonas sp. KR1-144]|uniref:carboxymuconolactone decarboxylase family protein n=1 Tax=Caldimonas sp. KR1-144 TaxID=3400911 RepID=UPI003C0E760B
MVAQAVVLRQAFKERGISAAHTQSPPGDSYEAGMTALRDVDGEAGEKVITALEDVLPDLGRFIIDFAFGRIYTRDGLGLHLREMVTVASLAAMGCATPQLKVHMHGFLNVGGTKEQLVEVTIQIAAYAGFPRAINAALTIQDVLRERAARVSD